MTRHIPDFIRARSCRSPTVADVPDTNVEAKDLKPEAFTKPYTDFITENPTVFHAVAYFEEKLAKAGYAEVPNDKSQRHRYDCR